MGAAGVEPHQLLACTVPDADVTVPVNLGRYRHQCVGDVALCENGFTLSFWFIPQAANDVTEQRYYFSSGGQSHYSNGVYIRQNHVNQYEVGVAEHDRLWSVRWRMEAVDANVNVIITWRTSLRVYLDGVVVGIDYTGQARIYSQSAIDLFPDLVIGAANDVVLSNNSRVTSWTCGNLTHWSQTTIPSVVPQLIGGKLCIL